MVIFSFWATLPPRPDISFRSSPESAKNVILAVTSKVGCGPVRGPIRGPVDIQFAIFLNNLIAENRCKQLKIRKLRQKNGRGERI